MKKKPKRKLKKSEMSVSKESFFEVLRRAAQPISQEQVQKVVSHPHDDYSDKQTHSHNSEATED